MSIEKTTETPTGMFTPEQVATHNADIVAKLGAQDAAGHSSAPSDDGTASGALDALAKQAEDAAKEKAAAPIIDKIVETVPPAKTAEEIAKEKEAADALDAQKKRAEELFKDSPTLAPNASPKSAESFAAIKIKAAQEVARLESELEKLRKENAEAAEKLKNTAPPETLKELEDHRNWRAKLDVEADPKFKEFDKTIAQTNDFIYSQLLRSPAITPEIIEAIKKHGGAQNVEMSKIFDAIKDPALQRTIESKIADIEMSKYNKGKAIEAAKTNLNEYVAEREKSALQSITQHNTATEKHLAGITKSLSWYNDKPIDPKADEAVRKEAEAHNIFVKTTREQLGVALKDDSPEMRAIMIAGMAQLFYLQNVHKGTASKLEVAEKALAEVTAKYDKLRNGSVNRLRESGAPTGGTITPEKKPSDQFTMTAGESLDNLRKQVSEERERAAAGK